MVVVAFALVLAQDPPLPKSPPPSVVTVVKGYGDPVVKDARITVHFSAITESGIVLSDSEKRGMPFTFLMGQASVEGFWSLAVENGNVGHVRTLTTPASAIGLSLPDDPIVVLTIKIIKVAPL